VTKVAVPKPERRHASLRRALAEPGRPLPEGLRAELEAKFAADFRRVRIHTGSTADEAARSLGAEALTFGQHILFRAGAFTREFKRLLRRRGLPGPAVGGAAEWRIPPLSIAVKTDDPPALVGRALARSLFEALHRAAEDL
jgi:hypothetical protein